MLTPSMVAKLVNTRVGLIMGRQEEMHTLLNLIPPFSNAWICVSMAIISLIPSTVRIFSPSMPLEVAIKAILRVEAGNSFFNLLLFTSDLFPCGDQRFSNYSYDSS